MIKLVELLREGTGNPKALIVAGAPGAGKGYILKDINLGDLKIFNIDNTFVSLLRKANVTLDLKRATPKERSEAAKAMAAATKELKTSIIPNAIANRESFVLDGTAASFKNTLALKDELEAAGYEVFMLYIYTDLERSLKQNQDRFEKSGGEDRSLAPAIVLRTWKGVTDNLKPYADLFGNNFTAVANTLEGNKIKDIEGILQTYLEPFAPKNTKPKTPAQQEKSDKQKAELNTEIQAMLNDEFLEDILSYTVSKDEAQSKLQNFLRS